MKQILPILLILSLVSCGPQMKKRYVLEVTYTNGIIDTLRFKGTGVHTFNFKNSEISNNNRVLISGVRYYRVLSITNLGLQTKAEHDKNPCGCGAVEMEPKVKPETIE